jgi:hypothetical protein
MQEEALCDLMMWNMNGPSVKEFDPTKAVNQWYFSSKTTRHVHGHKRPNKEQWKYVQSIVAILHQDIVYIM